MSRLSQHEDLQQNNHENTSKAGRQLIALKEYLQISLFPRSKKNKGFRNIIQNIYHQFALPIIEENTAITQKAHKLSLQLHEINKQRLGYVNDLLGKQQTLNALKKQIMEIEKSMGTLKVGLTQFDTFRSSAIKPMISCHESTTEIAEVFSSIVSTLQDLSIRLTNQQQATPQNTTSNNHTPNFKLACSNHQKVSNDEFDKQCQKDLEAQFDENFKDISLPK